MSMGHPAGSMTQREDKEVADGDVCIHADSISIADG